MVHLFSFVTSPNKTGLLPLLAQQAGWVVQGWADSYTTLSPPPAMPGCRSGSRLCYTHWRGPCHFEWNLTNICVPAPPSVRIVLTALQYTVDLVRRQAPCPAVPVLFDCQGATGPGGPHVKAAALPRQIPTVGKSPALRRQFPPGDITQESPGPAGTVAAFPSVSSPARGTGGGLWLSPARSHSGS